MRSHLDHTAPRLYVPEPLAPGLRLVVAPAQAHYIGNVMRRGAGQTVRLFNGQNGEFLAQIAELRRDHCLLKVTELVRPQQPEPDIWLVFALLKRHPMDLLIQKATELGVSALLPVFTTHTQADRANHDRLRAIAIGAAEQSERLSIPALRPPRALNAVLAQWPAERRLVAALEREPGAPVRAGQGRPDGLLIGPEGGFTDAELDAVRACPFVETASLGPRILRAETAAIVGLALLQAG